MLSRTILVALVSAACFATVNAADCSSKNEKCCQQLQDSKNLDASTLGLLGLLGVDVGSLTGNVGVQCTPLVGDSCSAQTACCTGNNYNGLIVLACNPISL